MLAFTLEALFEVLSGDKAGVIGVKVVESKHHVGVLKGFFPVNRHRQELGVIDLAGIAQICIFENCFNILLGYLNFLHGQLDVSHF